MTLAVLPPVLGPGHPSDKQSNKGRPEFSCAEDPHTVLMVLSMLSLMMYSVNCCGIHECYLAAPRQDGPNELGMLVRLHSIHQMQAAVHWSAIRAMATNFSVALWPMIVPKENGVTMMLMTLALLVSLMFLRLIKP